MAASKKTLARQALRVKDLHARGLSVSKGGLTVASNLQWVLIDVNCAKFALSTAEFITLCRAVVLETDYKQAEAAASSQTHDTRSN